MEEPGKPELKLINLREAAEAQHARFKEVQLELDQLKNELQTTATYKEYAAHHYVFDVSMVPGFSAILAPLIDIVAEVRTDATITERRHKCWINGVLRIKGVKVQVIKGKKDIGLEGTVFWYGDSQWGTRIGIKTGATGPDGKDVVHWNYSRNCDVFLTKEQYDSI